MERYKQALGGADAIRKVQSETGHAEVDGPGGHATLILYSKPLKGLTKVKRADGTEITSGFDGQVSWSVTPKGASIDRDTPVEAVRRDADLQYALHQPDYFTKLELAGVTDFEGQRCYWLHGTTHWGKDNNQFYDVETGYWPVTAEVTGPRPQGSATFAAVVVALPCGRGSVTATRRRGSTYPRGSGWRPHCGWATNKYCRCR